MPAPGFAACAGFSFTIPFRCGILFPERAFGGNRVEETDYRGHGILEFADAPNAIGPEVFRSGDKAIAQGERK